MLSGHVADVMLEDLKHQSKPYEPLPRLLSNPKIQRSVAYKGIIAKVARRLRVSPSFVSRVARGVGSSARVHSALAAEIERIERSLHKPERRAA